MGGGCVCVYVWNIPGWIYNNVNFYEQGINAVYMKGLTSSSPD